MLIDFVLQPSGFTANVPAITVAHVFVCDIASLKERNDIFVDCRKNGFGREYQPKFSCSEAITHRNLDLFLEFKRNAANPRKFCVNWALLGSFFFSALNFVMA